MQIYGASQVHGPQGVNPPHHSAHRVTDVGANTPAGAVGDELELSEAGQLASRLVEWGEIRHERVAEIRQAIAAGNYETAEKLSVAVDRLLDEIG